MVNISDERLVEEIQKLSNSLIQDQRKAAELIAGKVSPKGVYFGPSVIPKLISTFLKLMESEELYANAVDFVTKIIYFSNDETRKQYTKLAIKAGVIQHINKHLSSIDSFVLCNSLSCLGNIAICFPQEVFESIPLSKIAKHLKSEYENVSCEAAACALNIISGCKKSIPDIVKVDIIVPLINLLKENDNETVTATLDHLLKIIYDDASICHQALNHGALKLVKNLFDRSQTSLKLPALSFIMNVTYHGRENVDMALNEGFLPLIFNEINNGSDEIKNEVKYQEIGFQKFKECNQKIKKFFAHENGKIREYSKIINEIVEKHIAALPAIKYKPTKEEKKNVIQTTGKSYEIIKTLGFGTFGDVYLAKDLSNGKEYAIKIVNKKELEDPEFVSREIRNMISLNHQNIIKLYDAVETWGSENSIQICMEYAAGGNLHNYIQTYNISEKKAKELFHQIVTGVQYLHSKKIAHRDLKPLNILLDSNGIIKIADFGLSKIVGTDSQMNTLCGTAGYHAPEVVLGRGYNGFKADMFSLGITLCNIATNYGEKIMSFECKTLFNKLTSQNPSSRPSADDVLKDPWLA